MPFLQVANFASVAAVENANEILRKPLYSFFVALVKQRLRNLLPNHSMSSFCLLLIPLQVFCLGDGRRYKLVLIPDTSYDGVSYQQEFTPPQETVDGAIASCKLPFDKFVATWRGRHVPNAPPLNCNSLQQVGLMASKFGGGENTGNALANFRAGPFRLQLYTIQTY